MIGWTVFIALAVTAFITLYNTNDYVIEKALISRGYERIIDVWRKDILRTNAEEELNFLRSISVPDANIRIYSPTVYSGESQWKYFPHEGGN